MLSKNYNQTKRSFSVILICLLIVSIGSSLAGSTVMANDAVAEPAAPSDDVEIYLPIVLNIKPPPPFGVEMFGSISDDLLDRSTEANVSWVRFTGISWAEIEPVRTPTPTYHWNTIDEAGLLKVAVEGHNIIAVVKYTPDWAQKYPGVSCGPIAEEYFDEFAQFMHEIVKRYSVSPYYIKYWEIGNEPDVDPSLVSPDNQFGCWGDQSDEYYGGEYYASMLEQAYPAIKAANPQAKVLHGGLLLDCDPTDPDLVGIFDCTPAKFFEGILRYNSGQGGNYFDIVSFHGYPTYAGHMQSDEHYPKWEKRGGVVLGKIDYLREVMSNYGYDKPIFDTEGSLLCTDAWWPTCDDFPTDPFYEAQADYVVWRFVRNIAVDVDVTIWFTLRDVGWRYTGLLNSDLSDRPSFYAYKYLSLTLSDAEFVTTVTQYPDLRGFEFTKPGNRIWILWDPDEGSDEEIQLPPDTIVVHDKYGSDITPPTGNDLPVSSPVYLYLAP
jgi:hypothetical protein